MPSLSILTITRNAETYLEEALSSVQNQKFDHFEHIVWDGGSEDRTLEIARSFPHVQLIKGQDKGIADAMNKVADHASGDYLWFLHADDRLADAHVLDRIDRTLKLHPDVDWLSGRVQLIDPKGKLLSVPAFRPYQRKKLRRYNTLSHPATLVHRRLFKRVGGFDPKWRYAMDYALWLKLLEIRDPFVFSSVLAHFRVHDGSLSSVSPYEVAQECHQIRLSNPSSLYERIRSERTLRRRIRKLSSP